jgi:hypothetical protein
MTLRLMAKDLANANRTDFAEPRAKWKPLIANHGPSAGPSAGLGQSCGTHLAGLEQDHLLDLRGGQVLSPGSGWPSQGKPHGQSIDPGPGQESRAWGAEMGGGGRPLNRPSHRAPWPAAGCP